MRFGISDAKGTFWCLDFFLTLQYMGFFRMDSVWGGVDSTPPAISTNFAPIELKFSQDMSNHVRVTNQEKIEKNENFAKISRKYANIA